MKNQNEPLHIKGSIGMFDSGVGGLSIFKAIQARMPNESITYIADTAFAPYGDRTISEIKLRALALTERLISLGAELIVVACNSATAAAIIDLRKHFSIPIIGVEPGLKPALEISPTGRIGVLATQATIQSQKFNDLKKALETGHAQITALACPGLADLIERGKLDAQSIKACIRPQLKKLKEARVDTVVMGCTHYGFAIPAISEALTTQVIFVDTPAAIASEVERRLDQLNNRQKGSHKAIYQIASTSTQTASLAHNLSQLLDYSDTLYHIDPENSHA